MHQACTDHRENDIVLLAETLRSSINWRKAEEDGLIFEPLHKREKMFPSQTIAPDTKQIYAIPLNIYVHNHAS